MAHAPHLPPLATIYPNPVKCLVDIGNAQIKANQSRGVVLMFCPILSLPLRLCPPVRGLCTYVWPSLSLIPSSCHCTVMVVALSRLKNAIARLSSEICRGEHPQAQTQPRAMGWAMVCLCVMDLVDLAAATWVLQAAATWVLQLIQKYF